ncbi:unnamed protein product [Ranitomeya imitator]|uniref:Uncharacterized protein n=1 Tax=Ranitomeya imitator TaxID=111125 RepID=A0ABN9LH32_9NEOB|nr:unnamed protein product [Ranitomeya imitator]
MVVPCVHQFLRITELYCDVFAPQSDGDEQIRPFILPCDQSATALNQVQRQRKEMDGSSPSDRERKSKHVKLPARSVREHRGDPHTLYTVYGPSDELELSKLQTADKRRKCHVPEICFADAQEDDETDTDCLPPDPALKDVLSLSDVECSLCIRMFLEPVTTPCGHTFCRECLERCMDHQPYCPLCKQCLREYLSAGSYPITAVLQDLMTTIFPSEMADRKQVHLTEIAEMSNLVSNVPIFVCTVAFPGVACPLHVFEPRYRLMMRRCLEAGTKSFGMCLYESGKSFADYGCMLEIQHLDYLPDGRSLVETEGRRRFRVLERGLLDGYHKAEIEYLADKKLEGEELQEVQGLHDMVYQQMEECFSQHIGSLPRRIFMHHASPPPKEDDIQVSAHSKDSPPPKEDDIQVSAHSKDSPPPKKGDI